MPPPPTPQDDEEKTLSLLDHLEELRSRLFRCVMALAVAVCVGYGLAPYFLDLLTRPLATTQRVLAEQALTGSLRVDVAEDGTLRVRDVAELATLSEHTRLEFYRPGAKEPLATWFAAPQASLLYLRPMDPFVIRLKASVVVGIILALPIILYQVWAFVAPGLLPSERKLALPAIVSGSLLFPAGALFAYFLLDVTLQFLAGFQMDNSVMMNDAQAYLGFALTMMLAFGAVFELPLVMVIATRVGILSPQWLASNRRIVFVVLLVLSAVVTPTGDPLTLMAMTLPLYLLFEVALWISLALERGDQQEESTDSKANGPPTYP